MSILTRDVKINLGDRKMYSLWTSVKILTGQIIYLAVGYDLHYFYTLIFIVMNIEVDNFNFYSHDILKACSGIVFHCYTALMALAFHNFLITFSIHIAK